MPWAPSDRRELGHPQVVARHAAESIVVTARRGSLAPRQRIRKKASRHWTARPFHRHSFSHGATRAAGERLRAVSRRREPRLGSIGRQTNVDGADDPPAAQRSRVSRQKFWSRIEQSRPKRRTVLWRAYLPRHSRKCSNVVGFADSTVRMMQRSSRHFLDRAAHRKPSRRRTLANKSVSTCGPK